MTNTVAARADSNWLSLTSTALVTIIVGFASTTLIVIEGHKALGANAAQQASTISILCYGMAITAFFLGLRYRQPLLMAWSTPGSALFVTSHAGVTFPEAIGAFIFAAALMILTALIKPLSIAIAKMPSSIASAMFAGVLLHYVLGVPGAALDMPVFVLALVLAFFALRMFLPLFAVPITMALGLVFAMTSGGVSQPIPLGITPLTFDWPQWNWRAFIGLGVPLYLVTMASQNLPGFAVMKAHGYEPPVAPTLFATGLASFLAAPFGGHAINMAAITATMAAGPDCHPDPKQRWKMLLPFSAMYVVVGLAAGTFVAVLGGLPKPLVTAMAGLALFSPLMGGIAGMMKEPKDIEAALVTFLVAASGITIFGVGAAFWGLLAGLILWGIKRLQAT
jgi:benzoate membrane transport protein